LWKLKCLLSSAQPVVGDKEVAAMLVEEGAHDAKSAVRQLAT